MTSRWGEVVETLEAPNVRVTKDSCVLEEWMIDTTKENKKVTELYAKHSQRIAQKDTTDEEAFEELENAYTDLYFGKQNREMEQMAQGLLEKVNKEEI